MHRDGSDDIQMSDMSIFPAFGKGSTCTNVLTLKNLREVRVNHVSIVSVILVIKRLL